MSHMNDWRVAERAAVEAERAAQEAGRARSGDRRELMALAKQRRAHSDKLWRAFLGSNLSPLTAKQSDLPHADVNLKIEQWRRAQARAHAAEAKAVHAYMRFVQDEKDEPPFECLTEAKMLREESAACLQRVYDEANRLRAASVSLPVQCQAFWPMRADRIPASASRSV